MLRTKSTRWTCQTKGFWICGFDIDGKDFIRHDWSGNNVLLFGSEGYGLKYQTIKKVDFLLRIITNKKVESLNVSNSASIVFHQVDKIKKLGKEWFPIYSSFKIFQKI